MKQRVTYLLPAGTDLESSDIKLNEHNIDFSKADQASEEWRITLALNELPEEVRAILENSHELHLRWSSSHPRECFAPLVSRIPPGLHAFFTPLKDGKDVPICTLIQQIFGMKEAKCVSVADSFARIHVISERFAQGSTFQWHSNAPLDRQQFAAAFLGKVCGTEPVNDEWARACSSIMADLDRASHIDVDYDTISHVVNFAAHWSAENGKGSQSTRPYRKAGAEDRLEVGVLHGEPSKKSEDLTLGGYLTVVGEDDRPGPTLFHFPSRHHPLSPGLSTSYTTSFLRPTGLHPKLQIHLSQPHLHPPRESCSLHAYLTLPSALFVDRFQLSDPLFLESQNLIALRSLAGTHDLEAPDWVTPLWGSATLFELMVAKASDPSTKAGDSWTATIPLHLRYISHPLKPTDARNEATVEAPWPVVFWACEAEDGPKFTTNPFDRVNLGYEGLFGPKTMFYHVPPTMNETRAMVEEVRVPILNADNAEMVQIGTLIAVAVGFAWVCWKLLGPAVTSRRVGKGKKVE